MSQSMFGAVLAVAAAAVLAAPAQARVDSAPVSSLYENDGRKTVKRTKAHSASKARTTARYGTTQRRQKTYGASKAHGSKKTAAVGRKGRLAGRAMTASRSGGGATASRGCLQPAAAALLARIEQQFGPVKVISTCRPGARIAGSGKPSKHGFGLAVDFDAGGRKQAIVAWLRANHTSGGTMTYARMSHIHVDIGPRFVSLGAGGRG